MAVSMPSPPPNPLQRLAVSSPSPSPNPLLKDVIKLCKNQKDVDFLKVFDSSNSNLYLSVRHRYNQLLEICANGIGHLKLFTRQMQLMIDAQMVSSETTQAILKQYREEEPTLSTAAAFVTMSDEALRQQSLNGDDDGDNSISGLHRKTDFDAFTDIFAFERNMAQIFVLYWNRLNNEVLQPMEVYRKTCVTKLESIQENVCVRYEKLVKQATKLRETKVLTIGQWNELCDARHALRTAQNIAPDAGKTKKASQKTKQLEARMKKQFEAVIESVDKFNTAQDEFWNGAMKDACLQLESMEYARVAFYQEYFDKYHELLQWKKAEMENGNTTLQRAKKMMMTPFEIVEYGVHPIRVQWGNFSFGEQQYELPCLPDEIEKLENPLREQRIDPAILTPVYAPFGDEIKPSLSKHIKNNYSRAATVIIHQSNASMLSMSHTRDISEVSSAASTSPYIQANGASWSAKALMSKQPSQSSLFADPAKSKLFGRTNRDIMYNGGLPPPELGDDDEEFSSTTTQDSVIEHQSIPPSPNSSSFHAQPSPLIPDLPPLPPRTLRAQTMKPTAKKPPPPPVLPPRSPQTAALKAAPQSRPKLPPRKHTDARPPPAKSVTSVAKNVKLKYSSATLYEIKRKK